MIKISIRRKPRHHPLRVEKLLPGRLYVRTGEENFEKPTLWVLVDCRTGTEVLSWNLGTGKLVVRPFRQCEDVFFIEWFGGILLEGFRERGVE